MTAGTTMWPMIWRAPVGAGKRGFNTLPAGALVLMGAKLPSLFGTSGSSMHLIA